MNNSRQSVILYAEDDDNDAVLVRHAFEQAEIPIPLITVASGSAALDYLSGSGPYADRARHPLPLLVLLDLNMPGISGLEVLEWIRQKSATPTVVVIVLTSSNHATDIQRAYALGANGYLVKPGDVDGMIGMARSIKEYWLQQNRTAPTSPPNPGALQTFGSQP